MDALGDPTRRAIFEQLRSGPRAVGEIAADLPVSRPAVSQHLRVLKEAGLVTERKNGTRRPYPIDGGRLHVWEPPHRVAFEWFVTGTPTDVDVRFVAEGDATRVELVHSGFDRLEDAERRRAGYDEGWALGLRRYAETVSL